MICYIFTNAYIGLGLMHLETVRL